MKDLLAQEVRSHFLFPCHFGFFHFLKLYLFWHHVFLFLLQVLKVCLVSPAKWDFTVCLETPAMIRATEEIQGHKDCQELKECQESLEKEESVDLMECQAPRWAESRSAFMMRSHKRIITRVLLKYWFYNFSTIGDSRTFFVLHW